VTSRLRLRFSGIVQGVGFRPFVYKTAVSRGLTGFVQNTPEGVVVEIEGDEGSLQDFLAALTTQAPPLAEIAHVDTERIRPVADTLFRIESSRTSGRTEVLISPDIATCDNCLKELFDPTNRRYRYPFINCTDCGPRLTIIRDVPYDRSCTSMSVFPLCEDCRHEYEDMSDRRFHAEPNACPVCGPRLCLLDGKGNPIEAGDVVKEAQRLIKAGKVLAIKGLGGFHLCVNAQDDRAVARLRKRKSREEKPLAIMVRDLGTASGIAHIGEVERLLLMSPSRPIVVCRAKTPSAVSGLVAPHMGTLGIMLPYTPLHHLILERDCEILVMTSANVTDEPICICNQEAITRLSGIADAFVVHDREILVRCDDSVVMMAMNQPYMIRRSRGYAPRPTPLGETLPAVLALGAHLKSTVCIVKEDKAFLSPHIGDLETPLARDFFHETLDLMQRIARLRPDVLACDMHPGYYSTRVAETSGASLVIRIQHHHAHVVSCMAEHRIRGPVIGIAMDGTGYGEDGTVWGGEFLAADEMAFTRMAHLRYLPLPGGDAAIRNPWRFACCVLADALGEEWQESASRLGVLPENMPFDHIEAMLRSKVNSPLTSSLGRMFDAVSVMLGLKKTVSFEGQAAAMLEAATRRGEGKVLPYAVQKENGAWVLDLSPCVRTIAESAASSKDMPYLAASFHATLIESFAHTAGLIRDDTDLDRVVLSGGCFQNIILLQGCVKRLERDGFTVFFHRMVPANDGGVSLGQAVAAAYRIKKGI